MRIGSTDIREVRLKDLREQIALVAQETVLFNETIHNNIAVGRPGASPAEIEAAARHAHAHEFIMERPDSPILVLDEATSALDSESERAVQAGLDELMEGRTTICIAHRLSTIQKADVIVVLKEGKIVEQGNHDSLIEARGLYWKMNQIE